MCAVFGIYRQFFIIGFKTGTHFILPVFKRYKRYNISWILINGMYMNILDYK